jgi:integrase
VGLLRVTGQRVSDVLALRRADLTDEGVAFVQHKTGAKVTLRWTPDLRAAVDAALALHGPVKRLTVFYGRRNDGGSPGYQTILKQWQRAVKKAGVPDANLHDLRAVAVTDAHRQGLDAQALAGHSSAAMTRRYIRDKAGVVVTPPELPKDLSKKVSNFDRKS